MHIKENRRSLPSADFHATTGKSLTAGSARAASVLQENYEDVNVCSRPKITKGTNKRGKRLPGAASQAQALRLSG